MNKLLLTIISLFLAVSGLFAQNQLKTSDLTEGKWVNRSGGYIANPIINPDTVTARSGVDKVERFKTLEFNGDGSFNMDSAKERYTGKWRIADEHLIMDFNAKKLTHLRKNTNPNQRSGYSTQNFTLQLPQRVLSFQNGELVGQPGDSGQVYKNVDGALSGLFNFWEFTGFANFTWGHFVMLIVGLLFIFLAIRYDFEPMLLIPIGTGILIGNIPMFQVTDFNLQLGIYEPGSVLNYLYQGVVQGWYPPLIFLGIGAMTDFSSLISNPKLMLLGAAAQVGIFLTLIGALMLGFAPPEAGAIGIIGGADGPTAIFISSKLANGINVMANGQVVKNLIGPIAITAYSYMALVPVIQPPVIKLLTSKKERLIKMKPPRAVTKLEKVLFPIVGLLLTAYIAPTALPLLGMLFFGNLLKESGVTKRLAVTASNALIDIITMLLGITVGASTQADVFLTPSSIKIFILGALSFVIATAGGVIGAKFMNLFFKKGNKINPMVGAAGVSAVPDSARVVQQMGLKEDPSNHLLMHAMAPNVAGVIGSAVAAGVLLSFLM